MVEFRLHNLNDRAKNDARFRVSFSVVKTRPDWPGLGRQDSAPMEVAMNANQFREWQDELWSFTFNKSLMDLVKYRADLSSDEKL